MAVCHVVKSQATDRTKTALETRLNYQIQMKNTKARRPDLLVV